MQNSIHNDISSSQVNILIDYFLLRMCGCSKDGKCYSMIEPNVFHQLSDKC